MAKVIEANGNLILRLSKMEKLGSLHSDISVSKDKLISKTLHQNPWTKEVLKGIRAPGTGIPYVILLGTMRYRGGKDFTAIYKRKPVEIYEFKDESFKRWIVTK